MENQWILLLVVFGIIIISLSMGCCGNSPSSGSGEKYGGVLGQLADYQPELNECLNRCSRNDPSDRLSAHSNFNCSAYCNSVMTDKARRGVPPRKTIPNNLEKCTRQCNTPKASENEKRKCISMCYGQNEVADWCKSLWCPYSLDYDDVCMKRCTSTWNTNNNQVSWKWGYTN